MARTGFRRRWRVLAPADPAVGVDWIIQATGAAVLRIVSLRARLVTSAVVANRLVTLIADDSEKIWYSQPVTTAQTAGSTTDYCAHTAATPAGALGGTLTVPLPTAGLLLLPGHRLRASTALLDAGDQWSAVRALVDETPSDTPYVGDQGVIYPADLEE